MAGYDAIVRHYMDYRYSPRKNSSDETYSVSSSGAVTIMPQLPLLETIAQLKDRWAERRNTNPIRGLSRERRGLVRDGARHLHEVSKLERWAQEGGDPKDTLALRLYHEVHYLKLRTDFEHLFEE